MSLQDALCVVPVALFVAVAAGFDIRARRIPNLLTAPAALVGFIYQCSFLGWAGFKDALAGFSLGFGMLFLLWLMGSSGAGDVKLMGALGAWLGFDHTVYLIAVSTIFVAMGGIAIIFAYLIWKGWGETRRRFLTRPNMERLKGTEEEREAQEQKWRVRRRLMPYAVPVAAATWAVLAYKYFWITERALHG